MHTNTFNDDPFYSNGASARVPGHDERHRVRWSLSPCVLANVSSAMAVRYAKCGVMITELLPETVQQPALWSELDRERRERVWKTVEPSQRHAGAGNRPHPERRTEGRGMASSRAEYRSPRWTTRWDELPRVDARRV